MLVYSNADALSKSFSLNPSPIAGANGARGKLVYNDAHHPGFTPNPSPLPAQMTHVGKLVYSNADACAWAEEVADGLAYLHSYNPQIIHRDVKLDNVLLRSAPCRSLLQTSYALPATRAAQLRL